MKKLNRIALYFATYSSNQLNSFAMLALACLKNNVLFPDLPVSIADLTALLAAYQTALTNAAQGGVVNTAIKNEAAAALIVALRQVAGYIASLAPTLTLSQILSSGFDVVNSNRTPMPLAQPVFTLDNSTPGQLTAYLPAVTNARAYQVQWCIGDAPWQDIGIFPSTKGIVLKELTAGTIYSMHIRAVGGSTQYSAWSAPVSLMAM